MKFILQILITYCLITLNACGFHIKQNELLPKAYHQLHLEMNNEYSALAKQLRSYLLENHVTLVDSKDKSIPTLSILSDSYKSHELGVNTTNQLSAYYFTYEIIFSLTDEHGHAVISGGTVVANRNRAINSSAVSESIHQKNILMTELREDAIEQLLYQIHVGHQHYHEK